MFLESTTTAEPIGPVDVVGSRNVIRSMNDEEKKTRTE